MTPYLVGRVAIGIAWYPQQRPHHDADACRLQDALLAAPRSPIATSPARWVANCLRGLLR